MIYTLTLNPAVDHIILVNKNIELGMTNYYNDDYKVVGGKGINAAIILNNLGANVEAIGILGEENKDIFFNKFNEIKLKNNFYLNKGNTRVNYKIKNLQIRQETELNGLGFNVDNNNIISILNYFKTKLKEKDIVVLTGSTAKGINDDIYNIIGKIVNDKKAILICDCTKDLLLNVLESKPYLIKPNLEEICATLKIDFKENFSDEEIFKLVNMLKELGAQNVLLSMGSKGSIFFSSNGEIYKVGTAKGKLVNSVGAGDSMLAGFVFGLSHDFNIEKVLQYAAASGGATAFTEWLAEKKEIEGLVNEIEVIKLK
ncbi:1-phosphofructokinase [Spiroplasma turonicum]|uniref:1-phosphofructokinase n=1 Tax=Spiroplasma turonicum TaxID=216946 RepID=A0A0K1P5L2_9MOLU|nr:1-phosphofructokinase family hexose kinase [Spiroplasma turonicum]AKU79611.1 1-phosphofructokinase [Spiroplasma turonicum]ALX70633.1 1-phosphofructokinase [Spiroplasma turonicum]